MNRKNYTGYKATSNLDMIQVVKDFHFRACQVPEEYQNIIEPIIEAHMQSLSLALGNMELCYLRTKQHIGEK
jgi:hypothetical protein